MHVVGLSGYYLILDNSKIYSMRIGGGVELTTPTLVSDRPFCLTFWYFIKDRDEFRVDLHTENNKTVIWQRPNLGLGVMSKPWTQARVEIDSQSSTFKVHVFCYYSCLSCSPHSLLTQMYTLLYCLLRK